MCWCSSAEILPCLLPLPVLRVLLPSHSQILPSRTLPWMIRLRLFAFERRACKQKRRNEPRKKETYLLDQDLRPVRLDVRPHRADAIPPAFLASSSSHILLVKRSVQARERRLRTGYPTPWNMKAPIVFDCYGDSGEEGWEANKVR